MEPLKDNYILEDLCMKVLFESDNEISPIELDFGHEARTIEHRLKDKEKTLERQEESDNTDAQLDNIDKTETEIFNNDNFDYALDPDEEKMRLNSQLILNDCHSEIISVEYADNMIDNNTLYAATLKIYFDQEQLDNDHEELIQHNKKVMEDLGYVADDTGTKYSEDGKSCTITFETIVEEEKEEENDF